MGCRTCGDRNSRGDYCDFCVNLYFRDEQLREREKRKKAEKKPPAVYDDRVCEDCGVSFKPTGRVMKKCPPCRKKWANRTPGEKWVDRKPPKKNRDSNACAYAFFRKKYGVPNNVFRG